MEAATITRTETQLALIFERYITALVNRGRKPASVCNFVRAARPFQRWLDGHGLDAEQIRVEHVEDYFSPLRFPPTAS